MKNRILSFKYAFAGLSDLFRTQANARLQAIVALTVIVAGFVFPLSANEWSLVLLCIGLVFAAEAFNTAVEYLTDLVSPDYHLLAGKAKDAAAAGVLCVSFGAAATGLLIFLPKLLRVLAAF